MAIEKKHSASPARQNPNFLLVCLVVALAFFAAYSYASASKSTPSPAWAGGSGAQSAATGGGLAGGGNGGGGGGCCGGGGPQQTVAGKTTVSGGVQKVTIDLTTGSYSPNQIEAKAGVPLELDFKGPASSCNGYVQSQELGFSQDVSNGGTINVGPLQPGTYTFACSMNMYTATIVVK
jgi:hypothetical protein